MQDLLFVFDIDGTLLDSVQRHQTAFLTAIQSYSFQKIETNWPNYKHHTDSHIFSEIFRANRGNDPSHEEICDFERRLCDVFWRGEEVRHIPEIKGAKQFLSILDKQQIDYAFATGGSGPVTGIKLEFLGPMSREIPVVTSSSTLHDRESIVLGAVQRAEERAGRAFQRVVCVGDGTWDAITAKNLGYDFIGIQPQAEKLRPYCPEGRIFPHFANLSLASILSGC